MPDACACGSCACRYRERIMILGNFLDEEQANNLIAVLLYMKNDDPKKKVAPPARP